MIVSFRIFARFALCGILFSALTAWAATPAPVFVLNSLDGNVSVIDPVSWKETKRIPTGKEPHHLYLTPDEKSVIVANALGDSLTFIDPRTAQVQRVVRNTLDPYQLRFSPDMKWFVTVANRLNHIDIYRWDGKDLTLAKRIPSGKTPSHIWIDTKSTTAYATMQDSNELVAVDLATQTLKWRVKTGEMPADVFGTPDDKHLLVGLTGGDHVEVYDVTGPQAKLVKNIPIMLWQIPGSHLPYRGEANPPLLNGTPNSYVFSTAPVYFFGDENLASDLSNLIMGPPSSNTNTAVGATIMDCGQFRYNCLTPNSNYRSYLLEYKGAPNNFNWSKDNGKLQMAVQNNVFSILWGGGNTTNVIKNFSNPNDNGWLSRKLIKYYQAPTPANQ